MSITLATIGAGIMTGISHPITTFGLLTANTVMNGIELHNDQEMKGSLGRIESKQDKIIEGIETLQVSTSHTVTYSQMEKLLSEPVPAPTATTTPATTTPAPVATPAQDNNVPPAWAQQIIQQQNQQAEIIKNLMQPASPANTTVNVGAAPAPVATPAPTTPATTTPAATTPAPAAPADSALETKLDKLIEGFGALVDSLKQANAGTPAADAGVSSEPTA